jgi:thymidine phosphorylase
VGGEAAIDTAPIPVDLAEEVTEKTKTIHALTTQPQVMAAEVGIAVEVEEGMIFLTSAMEALGELVITQTVKQPLFNWQQTAI